MVKILLLYITIITKSINLVLTNSRRVSNNNNKNKLLFHFEATLEFYTLPNKNKNNKIYCKNVSSDLINQYNEKHSCDKRFNNWLRSSQTVDYLNYINNKVETQKSVTTSTKDEKWFIPNEL